ncbi:hypothetical protein MNBD_NITROSPINAE02-1197 [hydrothermal vent metagenome]|uniref:2Fe-2S ferredoxin-type domain-containing protein n=1 Tax=hydrothermal vent metagenome TaxID=652676 RepID=A0A3B1D1L6_9ZZZZ
MNSLERLLSVVRFQESDRPPVIPEMLGVVATLAGVSLRKYVTSGEAIAELQLEAQRRIGHDAVFAAADLCVEAEALGCGIAYPEDNYPHVREIALHDISGLDSLAIPDPHVSGRMPEIIKATRIMKEELRGEIPVFSHVIGPITLAARIMDIEKMLYIIVDYPERFRSILKVCHDVSKSFAIELQKAGADGILMFDPVASMSLIPPRIFREFEVEPVQSIFSAIKKHNPDTLIWYSVAGPLKSDFSLPLSVGPDIFTVDYVNSVDMALKHANSIVINGNIKPALFLDGNQDDVRGEAEKLLSLARSTERFILGSGCEVPLCSPLENIKSLVDVAMEETNKFVRINTPAVGAHEVTIMPHRKKVYVHKGSSLLGAMEKAGIPVTSYCDRSGSCGKCVVKIISGTVTPSDQIEDLQLRDHMIEGDNRLACLSKVKNAVEIYIPYLNRLFKSRMSSSDELLGQSIEEAQDLYGFLPNISSKCIDLKSIAKVMPISYQKWLYENLGSYRINSRLVDDFATIVLSGHSVAYAIIDKDQKEVIAFSATEQMLGLALDIGTTTISAYVHDLKDGKPLCAGTIENPQTELGLDVISRVAYISKNPRALARMQRKLIEGINNVVDAFSREKAIDSRSIYCLTVVANSIITHMFLGLNPVNLSQAPYIASISMEVSTTAYLLRSSLKLFVASNCRVEVLPSIGGFVGCDTVAGILATGMSEKEEISLFIDIGTNGEIAIGNRDKMICASVSAGPAFEGALLTNGLTYQNGVIDKVSIHSSEEIEFETVGNTLPIGLCGSGVIDAIAEFSRLEIINTRGRFNNHGAWPQIRGDVFVLVKKEKTAMFSPIYITSSDIEEIQKAKSAFKTGITLLMEELGVTGEDIRKVYISGSFGYSINVMNATRIGMLPHLPNARFEFIKNSAGQGARIAMLSRKAWGRASEIAENAKHINLANHSRFNNLFIENMLFNSNNERR